MPLDCVDLTPRRPLACDSAVQGASCEALGIPMTKRFHVTVERPSDRED